MKTIFTVFITLILITGIPACKPCQDVLPFFDILNISFTGGVSSSTSGFSASPQGDTVDFDKYRMNCEFKVKFHAAIQNNLPGLFSTPTALATKCAPDGYKGSNEGLDSVFVITNQDYDSLFSKNDTINAIVTVTDFFGVATKKIPEYIAANHDVIAEKEGAQFKITSKPTHIARPFTFTIIYKLHNGAVHQASTQAVFFR